MTIQRFWKMVWVRKFLALSVAAAVVLGALLVRSLVPPQWQA